MRLFSTFLGLILLLLTSCRVDENVAVFEGTYSGILLIHEESWRYNEGVSPQDTVYSQAYLKTATTVTFDKGEYTTEYQNGTFHADGEQATFFHDGEEAFCTLDTVCISFLRPFLQIPYNYTFRGDSLIITFEDQGTATGFGTPNTERFIYRYGLWLVKEE